MKNMFKFYETCNCSKIGKITKFDEIVKFHKIFNIEKSFLMWLNYPMFKLKKKK